MTEIEPLCKKCIKTAEKCILFHTDWYWKCPECKQEVSENKLPLEQSVCTACNEGHIKKEIFYLWGNVTSERLVCDRCEKVYK